MDLAKDLHMVPSAITTLGESLTSTQEVNSSQSKKRSRRNKKRGEAVEHKDKGPDLSLGDASLKTDATLKDPLHESPALPDPSSSQTVREKKRLRRKKLKTQHDAMESNVNGCDNPESTISSKTCGAAFDMPSEHPIQCVSTDSVTRQSCVKAVISQEENEEKEQNMLKNTAENSNGDASLKTDATMMDPLHESPDLSSSQKVTKRKKRPKTQHDAVKSNVNGCENPESTLSSKPCAAAFVTPSEHPIQCVSTDSVTRQSCVKADISQGENEEKEQNMLKKAAENSNGDASLKTDATLKDPLHESPALPDLSSSQKVTKKKKKRLRTQHNAVKSNVNGCENPESTLSSKPCAAAFVMPSEHPIQCVSTDSVTRQSCVKADISQGENEEKEQNMLKKAAENSNGDASLKTDATLKDPLHESPALPDLSSSQKVTKKKKKRLRTQHNAVKSNVNGCENPESTLSSKPCAAAFVMPSEHPIQCVSTDSVTRQSCVKADISQGENEEKEQNMLKTAAENSNGNASLKTDATMKDPLNESPALPDLSSSQKVTKKKKKKRLRTQHNAVKSNVNGCENPASTLSSKTCAAACDTPSEHPIQCVSTDSVTRQSCVKADLSQGENEEKEQNMLKTAPENSNGECDFQEVSGNCNSVVAGAVSSAEESVLQFVEKNIEQNINDNSPNPGVKSSLVNIHDDDNPGVCDFSEETLVELISTRKKSRRKKQKTRHNAVESNVNGCDNPENTFSSKPCEAAFDKPSEHPIQCVSTDSVTRQSFGKADISQGENEEKELNMLKKAAENSNGECDFQEVSCNCNSVVAGAVSSAEESVLEFVEKNMEQNINDSSPNPEEKSNLVKNASLVKKHDDDNPGVCDFSDAFPNVYRRRKISNCNQKGNSGYPSPVKCDKEPAMQDCQEEDPHKFSDGPLTVDLVEGETKFSSDQVNSSSGVAAEGMKLMTGNTSEQRFISMSSVGDVPVTQPEETNARQLDHAEIKRNDLSCPGDVSGLSSVTVKDGNSKISQLSLGRTIISYPKKKLLILDVNGLLADLISDDDSRRNNCKRQPDFRIRRKQVYKRPFCNDFLQFCFDRFHVGVWSSRKRENVDQFIRFLMGRSASKLLFCWHQYHCTWTEFKTVEDIHKPLVLKELRKLWEKEDPALPWEKGAFNESNTLLLDDSPYKALVNPKHTAVFPYTYRFDDTNDSSLGPGGDLRVYLEGLAMAENVQEYVASNPFGQRPIREANPSWGFYLKVLESVKRRHKV